MTRPRIAITTGEPAGIGPEISLAGLAAAVDADVTLVGDASLLAARARDLDAPWPPRARVHHVPLAVEARAGELDARNARYVLATLDEAIDGAQSGRYDAIVTAPVQKSVINDAGVPFTGHTEYLADRVGAPQVVMMLAGDTPHGPLRVALATTHLPLAAVPAALSRAGLVSVMQVLLNDLTGRFGITRPRIAVTGLNPHAGEGGHLGREEIDVIAPAIAQVRAAGHAVDGPLPADTLFVPALVQRYDAVLAMFHDQGLPVLKYATFGHGVNVTLGLPFVRTSVDHGTALDLAGTGRADAGSLRAALALALQLASQRRR
ncbi:MAG: 4-hydroxythreonine-4-phosphate dehydrogenase PdxA [Burkholderiaceae bacterium]|jgi:4-hydroxythreonine-4-phosphate dehydrogenase|nr:4-hydroxythreonine-4-phosphate dehydrogenase PdxA [Burkholderiaceae bacterium]